MSPLWPFSGCHKKRSAKGARSFFHIWSLFGHIFQTLLSLYSSLFLARLLLPDSFCGRVTFCVTYKPRLTIGDDSEEKILSRNAALHCNNSIPHSTERKTVTVTEVFVVSRTAPIITLQ